MIPYYLISDDREVARMVVNGERLQQPDSCPDHVYVIMQECWRTIHKDRPSVSENTDQTARGVCGRKSGGLQDKVRGVRERGVRHGTDAVRSSLCLRGMRPGAQNLPNVQSRCARGQAHFRLGRQGYHLLDLRKAHQASGAMTIHDHRCFIALCRGRAEAQRSFTLWLFHMYNMFNPACL